VNHIKEKKGEQKTYLADKKELSTGMRKTTWIIHGEVQQEIQKNKKRR